MGKKREKPNGRELFDLYYSTLYPSRWDDIKKAFEREKENVSLSERLKSPYYLDPASIIVSSMLPLCKKDKILDMCAAPGGKTLSLALRMSEDSTLVANDRSPERRRRLRESVEKLPDDIFSRVRVTGFDASSWCLHEKEEYDKILLDAPCSSERHTYCDEKYLSIWSPSRPKRLKKEQYALLSSAFITLKTGGMILYSTCSINKEENEDVISRLFEKKEGLVEEIGLENEYFEKRDHGYIILPDKADGMGPLYCCLIRKKEDNTAIDE